MLIVVPNPHPQVRLVQRHALPLPQLCPATGNPLPGSKVTITYIPRDHLLELYSLEDLVRSYIGSEVVRDIELLAKDLAMRCAARLAVPVSVRAVFVLVGGQQVTCRVRANPD